MTSPASAQRQLGGCRAISVSAVTEDLLALAAQKQELIRPIQTTNNIR